MKTEAWFSSFLIVFVATAIMTLLGVIGWLPIERENLRVLIGAFLIQMTAGVVALYLKMDFSEPFSQRAVRAVRRVLESFDDMSVQMKAVLQEREPRATDPLPSLSMRRVGSELVATITDEQLDRLTAEQRKHIKAYGQSMDSLSRQWQDLWSRLQEGSESTERQRVRAELKSMMTHMRNDLLAFIHFLTSQGLCPDDRYAELRSLIEQLGPEP